MASALPPFAGHDEIVVPDADAKPAPKPKPAPKSNKPVPKAAAAKPTEPEQRWASFAKRTDGGKHGTRLRKKCDLSTDEINFVDVEFHAGTSCIVIGESVMVEGAELVKVRATVGAKSIEGWVKLSYLEFPEAYEVETVIRHKGKRGTKARLYFVKWQGFPASSNSWEPRKNLQDTEPFRAYACEREDVTDVESDSGESDSGSDESSESDSESDSE